MKEEMKHWLYNICIVLLVISCFIQNTIISNIITIITLFIFVFASKDIFKINIDLPKNKEFYSKQKNILLLIISIFLTIFITEVLMQFNLSSNTEYLLYCLILPICLFLLYYKELTYSFKLFIKNFKSYFKYILKSQAVIIVIYTLAVCLETFLLNGRSEVSANQESLNTIPYIILLITSVLSAPFIEEIFFRFIVKKFIKNKYLYIIIVALLFGSVHVISENNLIDALIYAIPYATFGALLAYFYQKSDNIYTTMFNHGIHNLIVCLLMLIQ